MNSKIFSYDDQLYFSMLSGDWNSIHIDEEKARRSIFGTQIVHGIHILIWALNNIKLTKKNYIKSLTVNFNNYVALNEKVYLRIVKRSNKLNLIVKNKKNIKVSIVISFGKAISYIKQKEKVFEKKEPKLNKNFKNFNKKYLILYSNISLLKKQYFNVFNFFSSFQISIILATSKLVGMYLPGKNSIFSNLQLCFDESESNRLYYKIKKINQSFSYLKIGLSCGKVQGSIDAFFPPAPPIQLSYKSIKQKIKRNIFRNYKVLIIGASRGLGEVSSKIFAAGGAKLFLTYNQGKSDCINLANEIKAQYFKIDINQSTYKNLDFNPTHILYFASPRVLEEKAEKNPSKSDKLYELFYVDAFKKIISSLNRKKKYQYFILLQYF